MPLTYHTTVSSPSSHGLDSKETTKTKLNDNFTLCETNEQAIEDRLEDTLYDSHGSKVLAGMVPSVPVYGGLSVSVAAGVALIGHALSVEAQSVTVEASKSPGYIFLCQDGTWHVDDDNTPHASKSSFLFATYTSDGYDTLTVTMQNRGVHCPPLRTGVAGGVTVDTIRTTIAEADLWIEDVKIVIGDSGTYSNTVVDVEVGTLGASPASIWDNAADKPTVASNSGTYAGDTSGTPDRPNVSEGQVIVVKVTSAATGAADLGVVVRCRHCDITV